MQFKRSLVDSLAVTGSKQILKTYNMFIQIRHKTTGGKKPKMKVYFREHQLDKVMDLQKKPAVILQLKDIILSNKNQSILVRDLEKEVGFVHKWNCMAVIEKYPNIFRVNGGSDRSPISVCLTERARRVAEEEVEARMLMEPILVRNLRKLLMLTVDCRVPLENIEFIQGALGLPTDFKKSLIPKYPQFFSVKAVNGKDYLHLESWDSSLAVTAREEKLELDGVVNDGRGKKVMISRDGNYLGPHAFRICYPVGFRPNTGFLEELQRWQRMEFPSPYLNARRFDQADRKARKRVVGVLHELLSLTISKRMTSNQMHAFNSELYLPARLVLCLIKHHGIFYITNKGVRSTVFLKEAYDGLNLIEKCPILRFDDKFIALTGRKDPSLNHGVSLNTT